MPGLIGASIFSPRPARGYRFHSLHFEIILKSPRGAPAPATNFIKTGTAAFAPQSERLTATIVPEPPAGDPDADWPAPIQVCPGDLRETAAGRMIRRVENQNGRMSCRARPGSIRRWVRKPTQGKFPAWSQWPQPATRW